MHIVKILPCEPAQHHPERAPLNICGVDPFLRAHELGDARHVASRTANVVDCWKTRVDTHLTEKVTPGAKKIAGPVEVEGIILKSGSSIGALS
ncbi:MAG: hypothetical protein H5U38_08695 [Calditrichaeota bacterium]|nr:hypothetical protein [Calditrichota bacterium]